MGQDDAMKWPFWTAVCNVIAVGGALIVFVHFPHSSAQSTVSPWLGLTGHLDGYSPGTAMYKTHNM